MHLKILRKSVRLWRTGKANTTISENEINIVQEKKLSMTRTHSPLCKRGDKGGLREDKKKHAKDI